MHLLRRPLLRPAQRLRQLQWHRVHGVDIATDGEVKAFTIVTFAAPGVKVPFVSSIVDFDGTSVRGNIINVDPDPEHVSLGMKVKLATYSLGTDDNGVEAIGFGFEPISN